MICTKMTPLLFLGIFLLASSPTSGKNDWASFTKLTNSRLGQSPPGLSSVKKYLNTFGYLPTKSKSPTFDNKFDASFASALLAYQENFNLEKSGVLDAATIKQMQEPRCGVLDVVAKNTTANGRNLYSFIGNPWPSGSVLNYHLTSDGTTIRKRALERIFGNAFTKWSRVADVSFEMVSEVNDADIVIRFFSGNHNDGYPFDGRFGVLAHAFSPRDGRTHFDSDEVWAPNLRILDATAGSFDLLTVAIHEIGHILGLGHSSVQNAVMWPSVRSQTRKARLDRDDRQGIRALYGRP